jgi:hypothetical protein
MGNSPITIGVETDKAEYVAGSTLRGKVYLSISNRQSTGVAAQVLQLRLVGKESAVVHHTSSNDGNTDNHYERSSHTFFQVDYPLYTFVNQRVQSGQYEFPFQFNLPSNLPSSMKAKDGQSTCQVEYELVATLVQPGGGGLFSSHPNSKKTISVWATATEPADSSVQHPPDDIPVHACCCCCAKGSMTLEACVNKTIVQHNDSIQVQYRCQNNSSSDVHSVKIQLEQVVEWTCNARSKKVRKILEKLEFQGHRYPELDASPPQSTICCLMGGPSYSHVSSTPLTEEYHMAEIRIPDQAMDTYRGSAVNVQHILTVVLVSDGCCSSNPESATSMQLVKTFSGSNVGLDGKLVEATATATVVSPSAPSDLLDTSAPPVVAHAASAPSQFEMEHIAVAEAQALPPDWNAQTAQVVEIPMAEAMVIEPSAPPLFK